MVPLIKLGVSGSQHMYNYVQRLVYEYTTFSTAGADAPRGMAIPEYFSKIFFSRV